MNEVCLVFNDDSRLTRDSWVIDLISMQIVKYDLPNRTWLFMTRYNGIPSLYQEWMIRRHALWNTVRYERYRCEWEDAQIHTICILNPHSGLFLSGRVHETAVLFRFMPTGPYIWRRIKVMVFLENLLQIHVFQGLNRQNSCVFRTFAVWCNWWIVSTEQFGLVPLYIWK